MDRDALRRAIVNRGLLAPIVEYDDGTYELGVPGLLMEPWQAMQRLQSGASDEVGRMTSGQPFSREAIADALAVGGSAALGSVAAPKPAGAYVTSGAPMKTERQAQKGITAYHGSPHDFDKFDISKMGTGEGAQAYGPGLYFAENEGVARSYRDALQGGTTFTSLDDPEYLFRIAFEEGRGNPQAALSYLEGEFRSKGYDRPGNSLQAGRAAAMRSAIDRINAGETHTPTPGRMYEVRINADPEDFLDWDKPLSQQSDAIRNASLAVRQNAARAEYERRGFPPALIEEYLGNAVKADKTGGQLVQGMKGAGQGADFAQALRDAGIPGIKYLDQGSRAAGDGSRNYVVFDDKLIDIVKKYGIAGAVSLYGVSDLDIMNAMQESGY